MKANGGTPTTVMDLAALEARLDELALGVVDDAPGAREEYEAVRQEIARLRGDSELQERAEKARAAREEAGAKAQAAARRAELETEDVRLRAELAEQAAYAEDAGRAFQRALRALWVIVERERQVVHRLGLKRPEIRRRHSVLTVWVQALLSGEAEIGRPLNDWNETLYRKGTRDLKPLAEILQLVGEASAGSGPEA